MGDIGRKIALAFCWLCGLGAVGTVAGVGYAADEWGWSHPLTASAMATVAFLASCAVVLFFISRRPAYPPRGD